MRIEMSPCPNTSESPCYFLCARLQLRIDGGNLVVGCECVGVDEAADLGSHQLADHVVETAHCVCHFAM